MEYKTLLITRELIRQNESIKRLCPVFKKDLFYLTTEEIYEIINTKDYNEQAWITIIQKLCHPDARYHVEVYRGYLKWLIDTERKVIDKHSLNGICIQLWANAPAIPWIKLDPLGALLHGRFVNTKCNPEGHKLYKYKASSKFALCPYCLVKHPCNFCDKPTGDDKYCLPEAGIHCCNEHGRKYLSLRPNLSSIHSRNMAKPTITTDGRKIFNIRQILQCKDSITEFGNEPFEKLIQQHQCMQEAKIRQIKDSIKLKTHLDNIKQRNEVKTNHISIGTNNTITPEDNQW